MQWFDVEQGSSEWWDLRRGVPTSSRAHRILTPKTLKPSAQQDDLICELISEKLSLIPPEGVENFTNRAIRWGVECEAEARRFFMMETNLDASNGGFCLTDDRKFGASPDALVGDDAVLEIKAPQGATQVKYVLAGTLPDEYRAQCHMHMIVTGRPLCFFLSYSPGLPPLLLKVTPDDYTETLRKALDAFAIRYKTALAAVRGEIG